ncbi:MAG: Holliday junction resolvase RuvX [Gammaproteobacteria bacterium]|jgi:putative Holliday junction resolvase
MAYKSLTLLGFDFGTKSIGVAVGQTITKSAKPLTVIKVKDDNLDWSKVTQLIDEWKPDALIVGLPLNMDGSEQAITQVVREFANDLQRKFNLPVHLVDERLTTVEARAKLFAEQGGYRALQKPAIDAMAAQLILESWMQQNRDE